MRDLYNISHSQVLLRKAQSLHLTKSFTACVMVLYQEHHRKLLILVYCTRYPIFR